RVESKRTEIASSALTHQEVGTGA
ncbi:MAG: hypothetical protein QOJ89_182, partial [bacterium]